MNACTPNPCHGWDCYVNGTGFGCNCANLAKGSDCGEGESRLGVNLYYFCLKIYQFHSNSL